MNDLRVPIGIFFALVGTILCIAGVAANYHAPLDFLNVNLYCGISMLLVGAVMLLLARRKSRL